MTDVWVYSFILDLFIVLLALLARMQQGSWLSPGAFFALFWAVFVSIVLFIFPNNYIHPAAILWIFIVVLTVYVGSLCGLGKVFFKVVPSVFKKYDEGAHFNNRFIKLPWLRYLTIICSILGVFSSIIIILATGRSLIDIFDINEFFQMGRELSVARYSDRNYRSPDLAVLLFSFIYASGLFGGALIACAKSKRDILLAWLPLIPAIFGTLVSTTRATILMTVVCIVSSYISTGIFITYGKLRIFKLKTFFIVLCASLLIFVALVTALISRHAITNMESSDILEMVNRLNTAIVGSLSSLSLWFPEHWQDCVKPAWGGHTLGGPLSLIGLVPGYAEHVTTEYGNVFTVFRDLIADFTIVGSLVVLFGIGFLGGVSFRNVAKGRIMFMYAPILMAFYGFTLRSFSGGLFRYSTMLLAWLLFAGYLFIVCMKVKES